jgi:hypothetical protein
MTNLVNLYNENNHCSDKWGNDDKTHSYLSVYDKIFERFSNKIVNFLEIGIYQGDSLNLWSEYFNKSSNIYGLDCDTNQIKVNLHENINLIEVNNAYNLDTLKMLKNNYPKFNIIIDDGSHVVNQQIFFIENYFDILNDNGILIIEDAMCWETDKYYWLNEIIKHVPNDYKTYTYYDDRRKIKNNQHDFLIITDLK